MASQWSALSLLPLFCAMGCAGTLIDPGHRGLYFDPEHAGLEQKVLQPGYYTLPVCAIADRCPRIDNFDVTFQTKKEVVHTNDKEGLPMELNVSVIFRPIISELYAMDTEIGPNYYDEVVGPEFRSASRGVFARHSYRELRSNNQKIEDEIEALLRERIKGKHVEIASVTIEHIVYAQEILDQIQAKLVDEQQAAKQKADIVNTELRKKLELENQAEQDKLRAETSLQQKTEEEAVARKQARIDKLKAETDAAVGITQAKAAAEEAKYNAEATAAQKKAEASAITPLMVQMHAYDALAALGGTGTHILLGDWSKVPSFLFPPGILGFGGPTQPTKAAAPAKTRATVPAVAHGPSAS